MRSEGISVTSLYSVLSDSQVDSMISKIVQQHPHAGYRMVRAYLMNRGHRLTEKRVRQSLGRIDPRGVALRWCKHHCINRRMYYVPHPNALWHIDANMSLVRWKFVVQGGIDGFSRVVTYLQCCNNNRGSTMLQNFMTGVSRYGLPSRVRSDCGGENMRVAKVMLSVRGTSRGSHITGQSTRNQRIERLWKDVFENCLRVFYELFYMLEDNNVLDPDNPVHLLALHHVYLSRIQKSLNEFRNAWNSHGLSSAQNSTPLQLWTCGMLTKRHMYRVVDEVFCEDEVEDESSTNEDEESSEESTNEDSDEELPIETILRQSVNPLSASELHGIDLYTDALRMVLNYYYP